MPGGKRRFNGEFQRGGSHHAEDYLRACACCAAIVISLSAGSLWAAPIVVASPDGAVKFSLKADEQGLNYSVDFRDKPVIENSPIVVLLDGTVLTDGVQAGAVQRSSIDETYPYRGVHSKAINHCNTAQIPLQHTKSGTNFTLEVRAFNDGVAFRYIIPGDESKSRVPDEQTMFNLPAYSTVWYHDLSGHYEATHQRKELAEVPNKQWCALADDVQIARRRRLCFDHGSRARELPRHGT